MENITPIASRHGPVFDVSCNWFRLFTEVCELLNATTQVVRVRTVRMVLAGPVPNPRDRAEFSIMGIEKCEATSESIEAMNSGLIKLAVEFTRDTCNLIGAMSTAPTGFASRGPATPGCEHQPSLLTAVVQSPSNPLYLAGSMTSLVRDMLAPIHGRATANARRLGAE
ncbi:polyhydroxyalkanoate granule-associated phasin [Paraburkholderia phytofirmans]|uniref:polyhydroxyalkanoate granule-associated phasin n=1 Tax=Paraburkholderia phytofirmans TaxID=261302 RepID=UPI0038BCE7E8